MKECMMKVCYTAMERNAYCMMYAACDESIFYK